MKKLAMTLAMALILSAMPLMAQTDTAIPSGDQASDEFSVDTSSPAPAPDSGQEDEAAPPADKAN